MNAVATETVIERTCPHCEAAGFRKLDDYSSGEWHVGECTNCGFVYLRTVPVYDRMIDEFAWEKTKPAESAERKKKRPVTSRLSMAFRKARKPFRASEGDLFEKLFEAGDVLDVGCGHGERIPEKFTPFGIELSRGLHESADARMKKRGGFCVHAPAVEGIDAFEDGKFSGIILRSFLEHEWQPKMLLRKAQAKLADGGGIFVRVPNFGSTNRKLRGANWCGFRYPDHVNYFTADSLGRLAADCGLSMRILNPVKLTIDDNIKAVLTKAPATEH